MNSLDDPLDEQLRRQFQQVFDAYEVTPPASLKDRIWHQLPKNAFRQYVSYCLVIVGILLPINGYLLEQPLVEEWANKQSASDPLSRITTRRAGKHLAALTVSQVPESADLDAERIERSRDQVTLQRNALRLDAPVYRPCVWPASPLPKDAIRSANVADVRTRDRAEPTEAGGEKQLNDAPVIAPQDRLVPARDSITTSELDKLPSLVREEMQHQQKAPGADETDRLLTGVNRLTSRWVPVTRLSSRLTHLVASVPVNTLLEKQGVQRDISWFVRAAALNTYQQMTVIAKTGVHVQHVSTPAVWSGQTWGYQLSGGISWHQWDAYVSYG